MLRAIIFDWGDTLMRDFPEFEGPMAGWPRVELVAGVAEALAGLPGGLICCVASNAGASDADLMGQALERGGIRQRFHALFTSREVGAEKPSPRFFGEVARRIGLPPAECVMVGNDYQKDIAGARAAGMRTVWLSAGGAADPGEHPAADRVIGSMRELPGAIEDLLSRE